MTEHHRADYQRAYYKANREMVLERQRKYRRAYRAANLEKVRTREREDRANRYAADPLKYRCQRLKYMYGITEAEFQLLHKEQNGLCAICECANTNGRNLSVDHCHTTGKVRGLLCENCNRALGLLKEDPAIFLASMAYLARHHSEEKT